jgi:hypothetical protein
VKPDPPRGDATEQLTPVKPKRSMPLVFRAMLGGAAIVWILTACILALNAVFGWELFGMPVRSLSFWPDAVIVFIAVPTLFGVIAGISIGVIGVCVGILAWIVREQAR